MRKFYTIECSLEVEDDMTPEDVALMFDCFLTSRRLGDPDLEPRDFEGVEGVLVTELSEDDPRCNPDLARRLAE